MLLTNYSSSYNQYSLWFGEVVHSVIDRVGSSECEDATKTYSMTLMVLVLALVSSPSLLYLPTEFLKFNYNSREAFIFVHTKHNNCRPHSLEILPPLRGNKEEDEKYIAYFLIP